MASLRYLLLAAAALATHGVQERRVNMVASEALAAKTAEGQREVQSRAAAAVEARGEATAATAEGQKESRAQVAATIESRSEAQSLAAVAVESQSEAQSQAAVAAASQNGAQARAAVAVEGKSGAQSQAATAAESQSEAQSRTAAAVEGQSEAQSHAAVAVESKSEAQSLAAVAAESQSEAKSHTAMAMETQSEVQSRAAATVEGQMVAQSHAAMTVEATANLSQNAVATATKMSRSATAEGLLLRSEAAMGTNKTAMATKTESAAMVGSSLAGEAAAGANKSVMAAKVDSAMEGKLLLEGKLRMFRRQIERQTGKHKHRHQHRHKSTEHHEATHHRGVAEHRKETHHRDHRSHHKSDMGSHHRTGAGSRHKSGLGARHKSGAGSHHNSRHKSKDPLGLNLQPDVSRPKFDADSYHEHLHRAAKSRYMKDMKETQKSRRHIDVPVNDALGRKPTGEALGRELPGEAGDAPPVARPVEELEQLCEGVELHLTINDDAEWDEWFQEVDDDEADLESNPPEPLNLVRPTETSHIITKYHLELARREVCRALENFRKKMTANIMAQGSKSEQDLDHVDVAAQDNHDGLYCFARDRMDPISKELNRDRMVALHGISGECCCEHKENNGLVQECEWLMRSKVDIEHSRDTDYCAIKSDRLEPYRANAHSFEWLERRDTHAVDLLDLVDRCLLDGDWADFQKEERYVVSKSLEYDHVCSKRGPKAEVKRQVAEEHRKWFLSHLPKDDELVDTSQWGALVSQDRPGGLGWSKQHLIGGDKEGNPAAGGDVEGNDWRPGVDPREG